MQSEKSERIKRMLEQGKTWDVIMKEVHVAPRMIKKVQDAINRSKAFEMFENNWSLHQVSLKLDISSDKVKKYQLEYLELKGQDELVQLLNDKDISNLVPIAREMKARKLTPEQMDTVLKLSISVGQLELKRAELSKTIRLERNQLELEREELSESIRSERIKFARLSEEKSTTENILADLMKRKDRLLKNTEFLYARLTIFRLAIEKLRNSKEITNLEETVKNIARSLLNDNKIVLAASSSAICRTIAANPQCMALFSDPTTTETLALFFLDPGPPGNESWISKTANSTIEANILILMNGILLGTINTLGDKKFASEFEKVKAEMSQFMILSKHHPVISGMFEN
jgi:hypothetical protein